MDDWPELSPEIPRPVSDAATLTLFLAGYAAFVSVLLCLAGSFTGPQILIPGLVHAVLAAILFCSWRGLRDRRLWARRLLIVLSAFGSLALLVLIVGSAIAGEFSLGGAIFYGVISLFFALITWSLMTRSSRVWFKT